MKISNLTKQQKHRLGEYFKCKKNPIYFAENYIKLALTGGDTRVGLYKPQKDFFNSLLNDRHIVCLKSRQVGVSTLVQMFCAYACSFYKNVVVGVLSKSGSESTDFCRKTLAMIDSMPEWLRPTFAKRTEQTFITDNGCQFYASQVNEANPEAVFRGKAITILIIDEAAFIPKIDEAYTSCAPTLFKSQSLAKKSNTPYATIIISTPNKTVGKGKWYWVNWNQAQNKDSIFTPFKLHWKMIKDFREDPTWYKTQCDLLNNVEWKIAQELDMQFVASQTSFFPGDTIKALNNVSVDPEHIMHLEYHELYQYKKAEKGKFYIIGIDTASSSGNDFSTIQVLDYETLEQVSEFKGKLRVDEFCKVINLVNKIYSNNLIVPEANSYGNQVCEYLTKGHSFFNIYQTQIKDKNISRAKRKKTKFRYGLYTGAQNRPLIMDALYTYISEEPDIVKSERLALELIGLVDSGGGRIEADEGENDDLAIAYAFCCYVKLYDPPMAISAAFNSSENMEDFSNIAKWNNEKKAVISPEFADIKEFDEGDISERQDHTNVLLNQYLKNNLHSIMKENKQGTTIDILGMLDLRNKKTSP